MAAASSSAPGTSLRAVASNPTGGGLRGAVARADGAAPVNPPRRRRSFASRCFASSRRRPPSQTGGDPAAPIGLPRSPQPPRRQRQSLTLCAARRVGVALATLGPRLALLRLRHVALGRVRLARRSRCPRARLDKPGVALRAVTSSDSCGPARTAAVDAREQRGSLRVAVRRPLRLRRSWTRAASTPAAVRPARRRVAPPCAYASRPRLRCAAPTPRAARLASLALRRA